MLRLFLLCLVVLPVWGQERYRPMDEGDVPFVCEEGTGMDYQVAVWTQVVGSEENEPGVHRLRGFVRAAIFGGEEAFTILSPLIRIDGQTDKMYNRLNFNPSTRCFPIAVFEYPIHSDHEDLGVLLADGTKIPAPALNMDAKTLAVVGNTGCPGGDCEKGDNRFGALAADMAKQNPDLVIHLGNARRATADCGATACPDTWQAWLHEFFVPARELLAKAPLVMVRGEGDTCAKAGNGWFYLFQPDRAGNNNNRITCGSDDKHKYTAPWSFDLGNGDQRMRFTVIDTANGTSLDAAEPLSKFNASLLSGEPALPANRSFLLTGQPLWDNQKPGKPMTSGAGNAFALALQDRFGVIQVGGLGNHALLRFKDSAMPYQFTTNNGSSPNVKGTDFYKSKSGENVDALRFFHKPGYNLWRLNPGRSTGWSYVHRMMGDEDRVDPWISLILPFK